MRKKPARVVTAGAVEVMKLAFNVATPPPI